MSTAHRIRQTRAPRAWHAALALGLTVLAQTGASCGPLGTVELELVRPPGAQATQAPSALKVVVRAEGTPAPDVFGPAALDTLRLDTSLRDGQRFTVDVWGCRDSACAPDDLALRGCSEPQTATAGHKTVRVVMYAPTDPSAPACPRAF